jgi:hypothetical protein
MNFVSGSYAGVDTATAGDSSPPGECTEILAASGTSTHLIPRYCNKYRLLMWRNRQALKKANFSTSRRAII